MVDLTRTIAPRSDQKNYDDFLSGPQTITITKVIGHDSEDQPVSIHFEGDEGKPYKPCKSMRRVLVQVWGPDGTTYPGRSMTLYGDPEVKFGGMKVGGIRISHMSHIDRPISLMLTATRGKKNEYRVQPLVDDPGKQALLEAQEAADQGTEALQAWWTANKQHQKRLKDELAGLKTRAKEADDAAKPLSQRLQEQEPAAEPDPEDEYDAALKEERE